MLVTEPRWNNQLYVVNCSGAENYILQTNTIWKEKLILHPWRKMTDRVTVKLPAKSKNWFKIFYMVHREVKWLVIFLLPWFRNYFASPRIMQIMYQQSVIQHHCLSCGTCENILSETSRSLGTSSLACSAFPPVWSLSTEIPTGKIFHSNHRTFKR